MRSFGQSTFIGKNITFKKESAGITPNLKFHRVMLRKHFAKVNMITRLSRIMGSFNREHRLYT